jgi:hypothetical protein
VGCVSQVDEQACNIGRNGVKPEASKLDFAELCVLQRSTCRVPGYPAGMKERGTEGRSECACEMGAPLRPVRTHTKKRASTSR